MKFVANFLFLLSALFALEASTLPQPPAEKIYIPDQSLFLEKSQLFVNLQGNLLQVASVNTDAQGLYVLKEDFWDPLVWQCRNPECGVDNFLFEEFCSVCGWSRF